MDEEKEDILQLIDKILVNGHVSNLEKFYLWEHLSELITASAEAEAPSLRLAPLKRAKSFLKTNPAYYTCRRRVMEIVRTMRSFLLNLENTPRIRTVVIIIDLRFFKVTVTTPIRYIGSKKAIRQSPFPFVPEKR